MELHKKIAMRCTKKQFEAIRPKLDGKYVFDSEIIEYFGDLSMSKSYLVNFYCDEERISFSRFTKGREIHEEWNEEIFLEACGIYENYKITKETILKYNMKDEFPEVFKPRLEVGKWYKTPCCGGSLFFATEIFEKFAAGYGFEINYGWQDYEKRHWCLDKEILKATFEEVEEALKKEAVRRGYKEGVFIQGMGNKTICELQGEIQLCPDGCLNMGFDIFRDGKWATIIPSITKEEAEKKFNCKII